MPQPKTEPRSVAMPSDCPTARNPGHRLHAVESPISSTRSAGAAAGSDSDGALLAAAAASAVSSGRGSPQMSGAPMPQTKVGGGPASKATAFGDTGAAPAVSATAGGGATPTR